MTRKIMLRATIEPAQNGGRFVVTTWSKAHQMPEFEQPRHVLLDLCVADPAHRKTMNPADRKQIDTRLRFNTLMARELLIIPPKAGFSGERPLSLGGFFDATIAPSDIPTSVIGQPNAALLVDIGPNGTRIIPVLNLPPWGTPGRMNPTTGFPERASGFIPKDARRFIRKTPDTVQPPVRFLFIIGNWFRELIAGVRHDLYGGVASVRRDLIVLDEAGIWKEDLVRGVSLEAIRAIARCENSEALREVLGTLQSSEEALLIPIVRAIRSENLEELREVLGTLQPAEEALLIPILRAIARCENSEALREVLGTLQSAERTALAGLSDADIAPLPSQANKLLLEA